MASLINYASIVANEVSLIDTSGTSATEIRDLFTTVAQLQLKRDIADSYSDTEVDNLISNISLTPGPAGPEATAGC